MCVRVIEKERERDRQTENVKEKINKGKKSIKEKKGRIISKRKRERKINIFINQLERDLRILIS